MINLKKGVKAPEKVLSPREVLERDYVRSIVSSISNDLSKARSIDELTDMLNYFHKKSITDIVPDFATIADKQEESKYLQ